jgi:L-fuconolactonase
MDDRATWRRQVREEAIEPDLPIVDAHHHIWPTSPVDTLAPWGLDEVRAYKAGSGHWLIATIFSESHACYRRTGPPHWASVGETEYVAAVGDQAEREGGAMAGLCAAMVGNVDLTLGTAIGPVLAAHLAAAPRRFRGIRHILAADPEMEMPAAFAAPPGLSARPDFLAGFEAVARRELSFEAFIPHTQLGEVAALADRFPDTPIILNHLGGPLGIGRFARGAGFAPWRDGLAACAARANVSLKLGGLHMWYTGLVDPDAARPRGSVELAEAHHAHILAAIELFGPGRCMFESNFPVDLHQVGETVLWNGFKRITAGLAPEARAELFADTALRIYRADPVVEAAGPATPAQ